MKSSYLLKALEVTYKVGASIHRNVYDMRILSQMRLGRAVIGVGNLSFGGSGKTLVVKAIAERLALDGMRVGIVCRSYGAEAGPHVLTNGNADPYVVGDEAAMLAQNGSRGMAVASGRDKSSAARRLVSEHPDLDAVVVDDAYQHHKLHQDVKILIWPKPGAHLREFARAEKEADVLLVPNGNPSPRAEAGTVYFVKEIVAMKKMGEGGRRLEKAGEGFREENILVVGGLGPESDFFGHVQRWLGRADGELREVRFGDHVDYRRRDVQARLMEGCRGRDAIVTTEKDAVKLKVLARELPPIYVVEVRAKFLTNEKLIWGKIGRALNKGSSEIFNL